LEGHRHDAKKTGIFSLQNMRHFNIETGILLIFYCGYDDEGEWTKGPEATINPAGTH
jgi:hypothetical protein